MFCYSCTMCTSRLSEIRPRMILKVAKISSRLPSPPSYASTLPGILEALLMISGWSSFDVVDMIDCHLLNLVARLKFRLDCHRHIMSQSCLRPDKQFINFFQRQSSSLRIEKVDFRRQLRLTTNEVSHALTYRKLDKCEDDEDNVKFPALLLKSGRPNLNCNEGCSPECESTDGATNVTIPDRNKFRSEEPRTNAWSVHSLAQRERTCYPGSQLQPKDNMIKQVATKATQSWVLPPFLTMNMYTT